MIALLGNTALTDADVLHLQNPLIGGVVLFQRNFVDSAQLRKLTAAVRAAAAPRRIVIAVDQEGGRVQRFCGDGFTAIPAPRTLAQSDHPHARIADAGLVIGSELRQHGVDLTFAPVLDMDYGRSQIIGTRAYSSSPAEVADYGLAFANGLRRGGVATCAKHFPGHGYATQDSHTHLPQDTRDIDTIRNNDLIPFQRYADVSDPSALLMIAHIVYPSVDDAPASFSSHWLKTILREEMGYTGMVVCDDLSMAGAAVAVGNLRNRLLHAWQVGCDLLLVCQPDDITDAVEQWERLQADLPPPAMPQASWATLAAAENVAADGTPADIAAARPRISAII